MLDTIIVVAIIGIAAVFVGRRLYRQFTAKDSCCSGCCQSGSCSSAQSKPVKSACCSSK